MATFSSPSSSPPPTPSRRKLRTCARRCERACCTVATYFPLAFIFSLGTWAVWVEGTIGLGSTGSTDITRPVKASSVVGIFFYFMLNASYIVAVFTDPGSPLNSEGLGKKGGKYSVLPTSEPGHDAGGSFQNITVSSRGSARYCKKCHTPKPDRSHHCSSCKRCVLKMDHHCPWLATCLGLHNYKAFVLFLIYTVLFCWVSFASSAWWMYTNLLVTRYVDEYAPVNIIMLSLVTGIIGLVLTGFTSWHLYLCVRGQTTIECLEKTRYLSSVRNRVEQNRQDHQTQIQHHRNNSESMTATIQHAGERLLEFHANAVPGATRYEEGEEHTSPTPTFSSTRPPAPTQRPQDTPALRSLRQTYQSTSAAAENARERARYDEYVDSTETEKLPNAFDLGWRRNLSHIFGPNPWLWLLPICNTTGDGWKWEVSEKWRVAHEEMVRRREERLRLAQQNVGIRGGGGGGNQYNEYETDRGRMEFDHDYDYNHDHEYDGYDENRDRDDEYDLDSSHNPPHATRRFRSPPNQRAEEYGHSAMSMQTLNSHHHRSSQYPSHQQSRNQYQSQAQAQHQEQARGRSNYTTRPKQKHDFDRSAEGEMDSFQVSGSDTSSRNSDDNDR